MRYIKTRNSLDIEGIIPHSVFTLHKLFKLNNKKLILVGGCVRDFIKGDIPKDFDLATDATPDEVINILDGEYKITTQGESFFVVVVYTDDQPKGMEIATFRKDVYGDNLGKTRNPEVEFTTLEDDLSRRDLSYNALYYDFDKREIVDLLGGKNDLNDKISRFIGDPDLRILEDPLRILRILRFTSRYGFKIEQKSGDAIQRNSNKLSIISMERIWDRANGEFFKSFKQAKDFQQYLDLITEFKLWDQILPNLNVTPVIKNQDSMVLVLAQILDGNENLAKKLNACVIPSDIIAQVIFLLKLEDFSAEQVLKFYKEKIRIQLSNETISKWLSIKNEQHHDTLMFINYKPSIISSDVMRDFNLKPSPELGKKINDLEIELFKKL